MTQERLWMTTIHHHAVEAIYLPSTRMWQFVFTTNLLKSKLTMWLYMCLEL